MATPKVLLKRSSIAGKVPLATDLQYGELAINFADGKIFYKDASNSISAFVDSARVQAIADNVTAVAAAQLDSGEVTALVDSDYVNARLDRSLFLDSAEAIQLIDSDYVTARVDPSVLLDSSEIKQFIDSDWVQSKVTVAFINSLIGVDAETLAGQPANYYNNWNNIYNQPHIFDSAEVAQIASDTSMDSAEVIQLIDSAYVQARQLDSAATATTALNANKLNNQPASYYLDWTNTTNKPVILDTVDVSNIITQDVDKAFVDALNINANRLQGYSAQDFFDAVDSAVAVGNSALDSAEAIALIDSGYVRARQITYNTTNFTDSNWVNARIDSAINSLIDGAPGALDTLNELAAALNDDSDAYNTLLSQIAALPDSAEVQLITETQVDSAYVQARQDYDYGSLINVPAGLLDSNTMEAIVDSAYVRARQDYAYGSLTGVPTALSQFANDTNYLDSTTVTGVVDQSYVIDLINNTYLDSAETTQLIDSDYIETRVKRLIGDITVRGDLVPETNGQYSLGTIDNRWSDLFVGGTSIYLGRIILTESDGRLAVKDSNGSLIAQISLDGNTTNDLAEGSNNLYYTATRVDSDFDSRLTTKTTTDLAEGDNLYYTTTRADSDFDVRLATKTTTDVAEGNNLYYTKSRVDSDIAASFIDSASSVNVTINNYVEDKVDSAYVLARVNEAPFLDSVDAIALIDSAYVNARLDTTAFLDSAEAIALIDSAYVRARSADQTLDQTSNVHFGTVDAPIIFSAKNASGSILRAREAVYINGVSGETPTVNRAHADNSNTMPAFGLVLANANNNAEVQIVTFGTLYGVSTDSFSAGDILYISDTPGKITNVKPAGETNLLQNIGMVVRSHQSSGVIRVGGAGRTNAVPNLDADQFFLGNDSNYAIATDFTASVTNIADSAYVQARQITYSNVSEFTNDAAYIAASDSALLASLTTTGNIIVGGNLQVTGTTTTINTEDLNVTDNMIYMAGGYADSAGAPQASIDIGFAAGVNDNGTYEHVGLFRDATDDTFKVFQGYTPEPDDDVEINTNHASFDLAPFAAKTLSGEYLGFDSDFGNKSTDDLTEGNNHLYYTQNRVNADIDIRVDSAYVRLHQAHYLDSALAQQLIDASYIQANQSNIDSALVQQLIDSNYINGFVKVVSDTTPQLGGDLDVNGHDIISSGNITIHAGSYLHLGGGGGFGNHRVGISDTYFFPNYRPKVGQYLTAGPTLARELEWDSVPFLDSAAIQGIINSSYIQANQSNIDSNLVVQLIDSAYVQLRQDYAYASLTGVPTALSEFTNDTNYLDSTTVQGVIDATYIQVNQSNIDSALTQGMIDSNFSAVNQHLIPNGNAVYDLGDSNNYWRDLYLSGSTLVLGDLKLQQHTGRFRFINRHSGDEVFLAAKNVNQHLIDSSVITSLASALPVSTFTNDANYLDSISVKQVIDSTYIATAIQTDSNITVTITNNIQSEVDSAYVLARVADAPFLDSIYGTALFDSSYVQARQDYAYASLTGTPYIPKFGVDFVDSATVINIINSEGLDSDLVIALVDSAYIQLRDRFQDSSLVTSTVDATYVQARVPESYLATIIDSAYVQSRVIAGTDSAATIQIINSTVDKAYVEALGIDAGLDSALITQLIDSAYVEARVAAVAGADSAEQATNAYRFNNQAPSYYLDYNNLNNKPSIPTVDKATIDALNIDADTLDGQQGSYYLNYNNLTNRPTVLTTTDVKNVFNASGDDEISTGAVVDAKYIEFKHDGGSQHEFIVEVVTKTSDHRYDGSGSNSGYQIDGTESPFIQLVPGNTYRFLQNNPTNVGHPLRFYYDAAKTTAYTTGVTTNGTPGSTGAYTQIVVSESTPSVLYYMCQNHPYMGNAVFTQTRNLTGFTTDDVTEGSTNLYFTEQRVRDVVDSAYIIARQIQGLDSALADGFLMTQAEVLSLIDSSYIQLRQSSTGTGGLDSALITQLIDSAYIQLRQEATAAAGTDSATVIELIQSTVDSAYVAAREALTGSGASVAFKNIAVNTQDTIVAGTAIDTLTFEAGNNITIQTDAATNTVTINSTATATSGGGGTTSGGVTITKYAYTADSNQTIFTDSDDDGDVLSYDPLDTQINVYLNGVLLVDSSDFTQTDSSTVTLTTGATLGDTLQILKYTPTGGTSGGTTAGVDSAATLALIDSDYIQSRIGPIASGTLEVNKYYYYATASQSVFTGNDIFGNNLKVDTNAIEVYLNGILLVDSQDYSATSSTITLSDVADSGWSLSIIETIGRVNTHQAMVETVYEFDADSGQTAFSGVDRDGLNTLKMDDGIVSVYLNGILLSETNDYTTTSTTLTLLDAADSGDFVAIKVTKGTVASSLNTKQYVFTGQTGTTLTGGGLGFTGNIQVFKNGDPLKESEFAISNGDTVTLSTAAIASDEFIIQTFNAQDWTAKTYDFVASSGQTVFTGEDRHGNNLFYKEDGLIVYLNGIALVDSADYVATNQHVITFNDPVAQNDEIKIYTFIPADLAAVATPLSLTKYEYNATSSQTIFSGVDINGNTLSYDSDKVNIFLNGLLLRTEDYSLLNGSVVTLATGADSGDALTVEKITGNNIGLTQREVQALIEANSGTSHAWEEHSTSVTIDVNSRTIVDCSSSAVNVTLPAIPSFGDEVRVIDGTGNASTNNITLLRNGNNIQGSADNLVIDVDRAGIGLVFYNATQGWILIEN